MAWSPKVRGAPGGGQEAKAREGNGAVADPRSLFTFHRSRFYSPCSPNSAGSWSPSPARSPGASSALHRGETISAAWLVLAAVGTYLIAFRFYSRFLADRVFGLNDRRATPAERLANGRDYVPTSRWVLFGHHFAAIAGAGPLVGPVLAAQFGYLPGTIWIVFGVVFGGAVQDFIILFGSMRRDGKSLGQMAKEETGPVTGMLAMVAVLAIMVILLAVLALVVVNALRDSPWGVFTILCTIPIAILMGYWMKVWRPGRTLEASAVGVALLLLALVGGRYVAESPTLAPMFTHSALTIAYGMIAYGFIASVLPVWMLLCPRDYLSTFMKIGTILLLAVGILVVLPPLRMPAMTQFVDGTGPVFAGKLFPFAFITIACGAISGFHALVASGTTPKMLTRESDARYIGYGGMLMESFVAVMAMCAAAVLDPGVYFAINTPLATLGGSVETAAETIRGWGFQVTPEQMTGLAATVGETHAARPDRRGAVARGRHGADLQRRVRPGTDGALVPLRHHVRGAVHPHHGRHRHPGRPVHAPGAGRARLGAARPDLVVPQHHRRLRPGRRRLGLLPGPGRARSAGRHQLALAALRHQQPAPRRGRPLRRHDDPRQERQGALRLDHARCRWRGC